MFLINAYAKSVPIYDMLIGNDQHPAHNVSVLYLFELSLSKPEALFLDLLQN